jgi:hypothetical protein
MTKIPETITMQASPEDELDKMLFEAERLSALMRSSANLGDDAEESKSRSSILSPERRAGGRDFDEEKKFADHDEYSYPGSTIKTEEKSLCGRSTASSQAPNDSSVQAAIDAARKMELALKALERDEDDEVEQVKANKRRNNEEYDDNSLGSAPSPFPKSPPDQVLSPATVDSKLKNLKKGEMNEDAIKWEKVEAPSETDDDYVPIADYYSGSTDGTAIAVDPQDDFQPRSRRESYLLATKRRARRRRRKMVRALAALVLVAVMGYAYKVFFANKQQPVEPVQDVPEVKVEKPKEEKEVPKPKPPPEPVVAPTFLKQHDEEEALCSPFSPDAKLSAVPDDEANEENKKPVEPVETAIKDSKQLVHDKGNSLEKMANVTRPMRHWHCNLPFQCADVDRHGIPDFL